MIVLAKLRYVPVNDYTSIYTRTVEYRYRYRVPIEFHQQKKNWSNLFSAEGSDDINDLPTGELLDLLLWYTILTQDCLNHIL
jgi:hypothetical protein